MDNLMDQLESYVNTFSEPLDVENEYNEDIQKIEEKINQIKNRRKFTENYSGIETFDNIYEDQSPSIHEGQTNDNIIENFQEGARNKNKSKKKKKGGKKKKSTIGVLKDYFYKVSGIIVKYLDKTKSGFFYLHKEFDKLLTKGAFAYVHFLSTITDPKMINVEYDLSNANAKVKKNITTDQNAVKQYIYSILTLPVCLYATYNWFYLMVYMREKEGTDGEMERPFGDENRTKITLDGIQNEYIKTPLEFLFNYAITPLYWFDKIFDDNKYSSFANNMIQWQILNYFIIFIIVLFINSKFGFFDSLNKLLSRNSPYLFWGCAIIILFKFLYNVVKHLIDPGKALLQFRILHALFGILVTFVYIIITTLISSMSINVSAILIILFVWIHSIFGIVLYNKNGLWGIFNEIKNINSFIKKDYDDLTDEYCDSLDWFGQILMKMIKFLNDRRLEVCLLIIFIINFFAVKFYSFYIKLITILLLVVLLLLIIQISSILSGHM
jgi:hypothetical protein